MLALAAGLVIHYAEVRANGHEEAPFAAKDPSHMRYQRHVFVCINTRPDNEKTSCTARGGLALLQAFQERAFALNIVDRVAFNGTTCLGPCEGGPVVVVYPEGVWYTNVQIEDVSEIVESHLIDGMPVQRLQHRWSLA